MVLRINSNGASLSAQRQVAQTSDLLGRVFERLSSGQRINRASDDAAGLAVSLSLNASSRVFTQGVRNINDAISASSIAESAVVSLRDITLRQKELAEQAANGSYSTAQRKAMNNEINALVDEWNRIATTTTFNGLNLFDPNLGKVNIQAGFGKNGNVAVGFSDGVTRGVGDGTFKAAATLTAGVLGFMDFDDDGNLDQILGENDGNQTTISVASGNGDGTFKSAIIKDQFATDPDSTIIFNSITSGDIDGDGRNDLIINGLNYYNPDAEEYSVNLIYKVSQNGSILLKQTVNHDTESGGYSGAANSVLGDFNGDGKKDIAVAAPSGDYFLFGNGNGTFQAPTPLSVGGGTLTVLDFNHDGKDDLFEVDSIPRLLINNGTSFVINNFGGEFCFSAAIADLNQDGFYDLVRGDPYRPNNFRVDLGKSDGTFATGTSFTIGGGSSTYIQLLDINGDGRLDLKIDDSFALGKGDGSFGQAVSTQLDPYYTQFFDINNDGAFDAVDYYHHTLNLGNSIETTTSAHLNITTAQGARDSVATLDSNLNHVESQLASLGAANSRFNSAIATLQTQSQEYTTAANRITNVDIAQESAQQARLKILQETSSAVLAQANLQPKLALKTSGI